MPRSDWGDKLKIIGIVAFGTLALNWLVADLSSVSNGYEGEAGYRSNVYAEDAKREIASSCASMPAINQVKCLGEAQQAKRENQRDEQDLAAQKISAWWTRVMGIAALIGMALSAIGVWLIYTTFAETQEANRIIKDTAERELRPYLVFEPLQLILRTDVGTGVWQLNFIAVNHGQTPARVFLAEVGKNVDKGALTQGYGSVKRREHPDAIKIVPKGGSTMLVTSISTEAMLKIDPRKPDSKPDLPFAMLALARLHYRAATDHENVCYTSEMGRAVIFSHVSGGEFRADRIAAGEGASPRHDLST